MLCQTHPDDRDLKGLGHLPGLPTFGDVHVKDMGLSLLNPLPDPFHRLGEQVGISPPRPFSSKDFSSPPSFLTESHPFTLLSALRRQLRMFAERKEALPVVQALLIGKKVGAHPVQVRGVEVGQLRKDAHILFVTRGGGKSPEELKSDLGGAATLLVGETEQFAEQGGMVGFTREDESIRLNLNLERATEVGLKISSKLCSVAKVVNGFATFVAIQSLRARLASELLAVVASIAPLIDGDLHELMGVDERGEPAPAEEFERLREQLNVVKAANQLTGPGSPLHTLRKTVDFSQSGELEVVVMTDREPDGRFLTGRRYPIQPHLRRALEGQPASTSFHVDFEGTWISAAAPIRNRHGRVVAVIEARRPMSFFLHECGSQLWTLFIGGSVTLCGGVGLAIVLGRAVQRPLRVLVRATRSIAEGNLECRVPLGAEDEIGLLTASLNDMPSELQKARTRDQTRVTEIQRMAESVKAAKNFFHSLVNSLPVYLFRKDALGRYTFINNLASARMGKSLEEIIGLTDVDLVDADVAARWQKDEAVVLSDRTTLESQETFQGPDGVLFHFHVFRSPVLNPDDTVVGIQGIVLDITARRQAEQELAVAQTRLLDASRQAGMAEVATRVLHNVGNVLNSVNVSAGLVVEQLRKSKTRTLAKAVQLLSEHKGDLGAFLTDDPKGKQLPAFFVLISEQLLREQSLLIGETRDLQQNIEHINQIVAMQQSYAKVSGVLESLAPQVLLEDALRLSSTALARHHIEVVREFEDVPLVLVDRHKALQILVNLVANAKQALDTRSEGRRLTLRISRGQGERVRVEVTDNGMGIPQANLARIFSHGFTTKESGHGFGLHSAANAAKEMGGSLNVHSDGPGTGATFILELRLSKGSAQPPSASADECRDGVQRAA